MGRILIFSYRNYCSVLSVTLSSLPAEPKRYSVDWLCFSINPPFLFGLLVVNFSSHTHTHTRTHTHTHTHIYIYICVCVCVCVCEWERERERERERETKWIELDKYVERDIRNIYIYIYIYIYTCNNTVTIWGIIHSRIWKQLTQSRPEDQT